MPITFTYDEADSVLYEVGTGVLVFADFMAYYDQLRDIRPLDEVRVLADYMQADIRLSGSEVGEIQNVVRGQLFRHVRVRVAICAVSALTFGLSREFATLAADGMHELCVFRTVAEGREWLGLPQNCNESE
jgi:hypothetical protein